MFSAVAIEAFANELLDELLTPADFEALDRLEVPAKLLIGTRLAAGESPLARSAQPLQDVALLVKTRNRLVHPKPKNGIAAWIQDIETTDEEAVGPKAALTAVVRVAETMEICTKLRSHPHMHAGVAKTVVRHRQLLVAHSQLGGPKIMDVPDSGAEGVPPLWDQMQERDARRAGLRGDRRGAAITGEPLGGGDA